MCLVIREDLIEIVYVVIRLKRTPLFMLEHLPNVTVNGVLRGLLQRPDVDGRLETLWSSELGALEFSSRFVFEFDLFCLLSLEMLLGEQMVRIEGMGVRVVDLVVGSCIFF